MRVRAMTRDDLDAVADLEHRCFSNPWAREALEGELARTWARLFVIEADGGAIAGFVNFWLVADEVQVLNVAVEPSLRRRGLARALMKAVTETARAQRATAVTLEVRPTNAAAVTLYQTMGFTISGRRPRYYDDGEDALLMVLSLA